MKTELASKNKSSSSKKPSRKRTISTPSDNDPEQQTQDGRFADARWDPRFSRVPKRAKRHVPDERFKDKLKSNPGFRDLETPVDRFGRPKKGTLTNSLKEAILSDRSDSEASEDPEEQFMQYQNSESEEELEEEHDRDIEEQIELAQAHAERIPLGKATNRLAVLGLDWSSTRAVDVFASLSSFCAPGAEVVSVEVHPSKFGLERLEQEAKLGPQVLSKIDLRVVKDAGLDHAIASSARTDAVERGSEESDSEEEEEDDDEDPEDEEDKQWREQLALRKYEEERLKYYYAVAEFEDAKSADVVYKQCDGVEYAQSGLEFDLRFIPNDMKIVTKPRDRADKIPQGYNPPEVASSSLNTSKVKLSWDADDPERVILRRSGIGKREEDEQNLRAYLAGSSDEEQMSEGELERKKQLLLGAVEEEEDGEDGDEDMNMEISFDPGMFEKGEDIVKRKEEREEQGGETPWERRMRRERERKAEKREKRRALMEARENGIDVDNEGDGEVEMDDKGFDDAFFSEERSLEEAEDREGRAGRKKGSKKVKKKRKGGDVVDDKDEAEEKRKAAELELVLMEDKVGHSKVTGGGKQGLVNVAKEDEGERKRGERKRSRGRRRSQRDSRETADGLNVKDERFEKVFSSHLFAIDPTHSKFKKNETNESILAEKKRRSERDVNGDGGGVGGGRANEELRELAGRLKARAKAKRKGAYKS